jgi:pimeloyl-ACP methyl ester carboxylesterase
MQAATIRERLRFENAMPEFVELLRGIHSPQGAEYWKKLLTGISKMWLTPLRYTNDDFINILESTLIIIGDRDQFIPVEDAVAMYRLIPNAELAIVPNADHFLSQNKVKEFSNIALEFFGRHTTENLSS